MTKLVLEYFPFFLGNIVIKGHNFLMPLQSEEKN
jgi:hypothetical protein